MECVSTDADGMYKEGRVYATWAPNVLVKCPCTTAGLAATHRLSSDGIKVNMTLIFSPNQAILAAKAGAWCCSPFAGRLDDMFYAGGYSGHGIAMATYLGGLIARRIAGEQIDSPFFDDHFAPIPLYYGRPWFLPIVGLYYRFLDWTS